MEISFQPLLAFDEIIGGKPATIEIRQEVADSNEVISHVTLVQEGEENRRYDMRFIACDIEHSDEEPRWQFISDVPAELKEIEWTISEAILEKNM